MGKHNPSDHLQPDSRLVAAYQRGGRADLAVRRLRRPGPAELISAAERGTWSQAMADYTQQTY
ncbi:hypothetical protein BCF44_1446 [Kutzneria buriramensis]|uniref:Uncharacterized protein n=1 Tax=Kutzneria buriramensis TaxID=1045776 RepID=A0A3E0G6J3_9PSEU|nr:hypothetical protein BCF44_1446 [Kutzneria buriramensis]